MTLQMSGTGLSVGGAVTLPQTGRRCLLMGDSITQNCNTVSSMGLAWPNQINAHQNDSWFSWANRLTGQRLYLDPLLNKGVGGDTTAMMLARFSADVLANVAQFDIMFLLAGTNDINQDLLAAVPFANIKTMVNKVLAFGKMVVLISPPPMATGLNPSASQIANLQSLNAALRQWVKTQRGVVWVDTTKALTDLSSGTNGLCISALDHGDGIHPSGGGAYRYGQMIANSLNILLPPAYDTTASAADVYDATNNPNGNRCPNGCFTTTSGGTINNGSGTLAAQWDLTKLSGSFVNAEVVASVVAGANGVNAIAGNTQHIVVNMGANSSNEAFFMISHQAITTFVPGDQVIAEVTMNISGMSNMWYAQLGILDSDGGQFPTPAWDGYNPYGNPGSSADLNLWDPQTYAGLVFRTPIYTIVKGTQVYVKVVFAFNSTVSAGATIDIQGMTIRKVN